MPDYKTGRLRTESFKAHQAFRIYLDMGENRSHVAVAQKCGKHVSIINRWAISHHWQNRLITWQNEQDAIRKKAEEKAALVKAKQLIDRREKVAETAWELAQRLIEKAKAMLDMPVTRHTVQQDGQTVIIEPVRWRFGDIPRVLEVADSLSRLAVGLPARVLAPLSDAMPTGGASLTVIVREAGESEGPVEPFKIIQLEDMQQEKKAS